MTLIQCATPLMSFFNQMGNLASGAKLFVYEGGSFSVKATTYSSNDGPPNPQPLVLDSSGRLPNAIWASTPVNIVLTAPDGVTVWAQVEVA